MSTRSTIFAAENLHLYTELFDEDNLYFQDENDTDGHVTVISRAAWEVMRRFTWPPTQDEKELACRIEELSKSKWVPKAEG